jgi:hypothetical protein
MAPFSTQGSSGKSDLEIDSISSPHALLHEGNRRVRMSVEYFKVCDTITGEKWACQGSVEFPHLAVSIEYTSL